MSATSDFAKTPAPPYYAVIFSSRRTDGDRGYGAMAARMAELASKQPGYLGVETVRAPDGLGITISYWADEASIKAWKADLQHQSAQQCGKTSWYADYRVRIARVEREYGKEGVA